MQGLKAAPAIPDAVPYREGLQQKHAALAAETSELYARPHPDELAIKRLKVQKLQLKERMEAIEAKPSMRTRSPGDGDRHTGRSGYPVAP